MSENYFCKAKEKRKKRGETDKCIRSYKAAPWPHLMFNLEIQILHGGRCKVYSKEEPMYYFSERRCQEEAESQHRFSFFKFLNLIIFQRRSLGSSFVAKMRDVKET